MLASAQYSLRNSRTDRSQSCQVLMKSSIFLILFFRSVFRVQCLKTQFLSLTLPNFLADPQELDLLPGEIEITVPSVFEQIAYLLLVRAVELT